MSEIPVGGIAGTPLTSDAAENTIDTPLEITQVAAILIALSPLGG
jgi:hypothetical protein